MKTAVLVEKNGNSKTVSLKSFSLEELCKKAGFKSINGFECHQTWKLNDNTTVYLYGKQTGRANQENKFEFPPPVNNLFFGACILCHKNTLNDFIDLTSNDWEQYYEELYGGFEDIQTDEELSIEEKCDKNQLTTTGYIKDGFVVEDCNEEEESDIETNFKHKKQKKTSKPVVNEELYLDCTSELSEEEYI